MSTKKWTIDTDHSNIGFRVKHMMFSKITGNFQSYEADITMEDGNLETAKFSFNAKADSVSTNNEKRDAHLRTADFFNAEKNNSVSFSSNKIVKNGDVYTVEGDLTMNGQAKPVTLDAEYSGVMKDPWGQDRIAVVLKGKINRNEWGITFNQALESGGVLVGETVTLEVESQFI